MSKDHFFDLGVDHHLGAQDTGLVGAIEGCAFCANTMKRGLNDCVLFSVYCSAQFMACAAFDALPQASHITAVGQASRCTVVTGGEDSFIPDQHSTNLVSKAGCSPGDCNCDLHEVLVESWPIHPYIFSDRSLISFLLCQFLPRRKLNIHFCFQLVA